MIIILKWTDKRYHEGVKFTYKYIKNDEWKELKKRFYIIKKSSDEKEAKNYILKKFTKTKNKNKLISLTTDDDGSYWTIYPNEN